VMIAMVTDKLVIAADHNIAFSISLNEGKSFAIKVSEIFV
jgi:hypothetical protein